MGNERQTTIDEFRGIKENHSREIIDGFTIEDMINRVVYWFFRYEGKRTVEGKDFSESDLKILEKRISMLRKMPLMFSWNCPDMGIECCCDIWVNVSQ